jgi:hypothetical protein
MTEELGFRCRPASIAAIRDAICTGGEPPGGADVRAGAVLPLARGGHGVHRRVHGAGRFQHHAAPPAAP